MNRFFILLISLLLSARLIAQDGDYFVSQFSPTLSQEDQTYFDLLFSATDEMIAAYRAGIIKFDGNKWDNVRTPSAPLSVSLDSATTMYVGCVDDFGIISIVDAQKQFTSLADKSNKALTFKTLYHHNSVYFLQARAIHAYDISKKELTSFFADSTDSEFINMLTLDDQLWFETLNDTYLLQDSLIQSNRLLPDKSWVINDAKNNHTDKVVLSGSEGKVYLYDGSFNPLEALSGFSVNDLTWINDNLIALSTLSDGLYFYDVHKKKISGHIDSNNGLPDNEIFSIAADQSNGVWIANTFGFTRVAPQLPIRSFNHYPGLEGNLTTAAYINNTWNIATSNGIYYFDQIDKYKNVVYYVAKEDTPSKKVFPNISSKNSKDETKEARRDKKRLNNFFSKRKNKDKTDEAEQESEKNQNPAIAQIKNSFKKVFQSNKSNEGSLLSRIKLPIGNKTKKVQYERRVRKELVSTQYLFKQVPDIAGKIKQLIPFNDSKIAVTPSSIIEIKENSAEEIFQESIGHVFHPKGSQTLWISTTSGGVIRMDMIEDVWVEYQSLNTTGDIILSIEQDKSGVLWMAGANQLFRVEQTDTTAFIANTYPLENKFFDKIKIAFIQDELYLINNKGIFKLNAKQDSLIADDSLMMRIGKIKRHLVQADGRPWVHNGNNWLRIEPNGELTTFPYLKLFPKMTYIEQVEDELWLINDHQSLYKFIPSNTDSIPAAKMYFRKISDGKGLLALDDEQVNISFDRNSVSVEMARPDYLNLVNVEYQYQMIGLNEQWSDWSQNNRLEFNYLPPGKYTLTVRSRDTFGRTQESNPITFKITPPYWQTTWFSALEVLFFVALILISSRLNRQESTTRKQYIISNLLTIVTIVMIIELLQNIAESYFGNLNSPVMAFGLDVLIALLIFPIETLLKWVVTGQKNKINTPHLEKNLES